VTALLQNKITYLYIFQWQNNNYFLTWWTENEEKKSAKTLWRHILCDILISSGTPRAFPQVKKQTCFFTWGKVRGVPDDLDLLVLSVDKYSKNAVSISETLENFCYSYSKTWLCLFFGKVTFSSCTCHNIIHSIWLVIQAYENREIWTMRKCFTCHLVPVSVEPTLNTERTVKAKHYEALFNLFGFSIC